MPDARPPLRRDAERNRQRILDAAKALIGRRGLEIGHFAIAKEAGVGVGTVYRRFPTREALFDELFYDELKVMIATAETAGELDDPWAAICQFMERTCEQQAASRGLRELLIGHRGGTELARQAHNQVEPVVARLVARAHATGQLRPDIEPADFGIVTHIINTVILASRDAAPDLWRRWLAVILDGMHTGPRRDRLPGPGLDSRQIERIIAGDPGSTPQS